MKYTTDAYLITCFTNMHVGSGEANYGVVDNLIQRDPITEIPIIHSSSLKGALREFFKDEWVEDDPKLNYVFGSDTSRNTKSDSGIGHYKFFDANLVIFPVRSSVRPFFRATSKFLFDDINQKANALGLVNFNINPFNEIEVDKDIPRVAAGNNECILEDYPAQNGLSLKNDAVNRLGENLALFHHDNFKDLMKRLPVIARNQLENGQSQNLWYEEVVPRESRFVFFISKTNDTAIVNPSDFDTKIQEKVIQIGGNASIGYGYSKIKKLS